MLRVKSLFSGIGGFELGLKRAGCFEPVSFCEMKPHAQAVLAKNFPGIPCHNDVTKCEFQEGEADVITAGFPCQDISYAGLGAGLSGARSGLYREVIRAVRVVRPLYALLENVAALLSRGLDTVLGDLAAIGYDAEWHCIPASAVGAPHRRDRIWIVAHARGEQNEGDRSPLSGALASELSRAFARNTSSQAWNDDEADAQHSDANRVGSHRTAIDLNGGSELRNQQVRELGPAGEGLAHADRPFCSRLPIRATTEIPELVRRGEYVADAKCVGCTEMEQPVVGGSNREGTASPPNDSSFAARWGWWATEPGLGRVAHGVPNRVDRLEELGNAVVPQIPEMIGRAILSQWEAA